MAEMEELLERVGKATGPDRELDLAIGLALGGWEVGPDGDFGGNYLHADGVLYAHPTSSGAGYTSFTESLDAALALVERVLPTVGDSGSWDIGTDHAADGRYFYAALWSKRYEGGEEIKHRHSAPLALLAAILRALIKDQSNG